MDPGLRLAEQAGRNQDIRQQIERRRLRLEARAARQEAAKRLTLVDDNGFPVRTYTY